eukprot:TRINITY_DN98665_c0_g1_i1.p1 TRINITY_DN98665_c0_g1~~TRINITY_DN98665_c0_g1_i1.p1  ORF type:complete len:177 (-),score=48.12 TRINITY_DN98665_c0_g1_i1:90-590(-)
MPPKKKLCSGFSWKDINPARLEGHLESDSFTAFCKAKLKRNDAAVLKLLKEFHSHKEACVFCEVPFHPHFPGECVTYHQVDESTKRSECFQKGADVKSRYSFFGTCTLCGESITGAGDEDGPEEWEGDDGAVCYSGPHCSSYPDGYGDNRGEGGESEEQEDDECAE